MAAMYDYDGAIQLLKEQPDYETNTGMQEAVTEYTKTKESCEEYPLEDITHVFSISWSKIQRKLMGIIRQMDIIRL